MPYRRAAIPYWLIGALATTLVILAALQYRWSGQISEAERDRMRGNLQIAGSQFRMDFSRDLLSLGSGFQADTEVVEKRDWERLARQSAEWLHAAPAGSGLIAGVYLWQSDSDGFSRLNRTSQQFETVAVPANLAKPMQQLREQMVDNRFGRAFRMLTTWTLDTRGPALIHPLYEFSDGGQRPRPHLVGVVVVALDKQFLQQKFLPELVVRHFAAPDGLLYNVAVLSADAPDRPIYRSEGFNSANLASADLNIALLDGRPRNGPDRGPGGPGFGGFGQSAGDRAESDRVPPGRGGARGKGEGPPRDRGRYGNRFAPAPLSLASDNNASWRLVARHRAGSVDVAVAHARWRVLAVSFAILMLLGASMAMIVISTQRAQRLARLQMEFVAGISHELRTPLTVISSAAQNLSDGIVDGKTQVKLYGTLIRNESRRLAGMMEQILQFASGQKKRSYKPTPIAPVDLVENAISLASTLIQEAGVTVERQFAPDLPNVMGESGALTQCLQNLIANAVKYGGEAKWLGIRMWAAEDSVRIAIEDHGIGIDEDDLPHVFEAFYRSRAVTAAQIHGTGLGLSLAQNFAREAGGGITVESTPGKGSCFTLRLPAAPATVLEPAGSTV